MDGSLFWNFIIFFAKYKQISCKNVNRLWKYVKKPPNRDDSAVFDVFFVQKEINAYNFPTWCCACRQT